MSKFEMGICTGSMLKKPKNKHARIRTSPHRKYNLSVSHVKVETCKKLITYEVLTFEST